MNAITVMMEAWRYVRRAMEREGEYHPDFWCPDCGDITGYLETGVLHTPVPPENWRTEIWWAALQELKAAGVTNGKSPVPVWMNIQTNETVSIMHDYGPDDYEIDGPLFPGQVFGLCSEGAEE
jgi:hypothetical protein